MKNSKNIISQRDVFLSLKKKKGQQHNSHWPKRNINQGLFRLLGLILLFSGYQNIRGRLSFLGQQ